MFFIKKIPKIQHVIPVYAVIVTVTYGWSLIHFFWNLSSWLYFSSVGEIFVIFAYMMVVNLVESLFLLFFIIAIHYIIPSIWLSDQFIVKGVLSILIGLGFLIYRNHYFPAKALYELTSFQWISILSVEVVIFIAPFYKTPFLCNAIEKLADRFIVFLYIAIPVSVISIVIVLFRNLL